MARGACLSVCASGVCACTRTLRAHVRQTACKSDKKRLYVCVCERDVFNSLTKRRGGNLGFSVSADLCMNDSAWVHMGVNMCVLCFIIQALPQSPKRSSIHTQMLLSSHTDICLIRYIAKHQYYGAWTEPYKSAHPKSSWHCLFKQASYGREQPIFHWPASKSHASWPQWRANG